ncbi:MAG: class II fructose-bisphosphate aldolase [Candidatus Spechtbacterales bacterium]|nr:class II fructose-bisphosphate aldolase [Candidatus Spechtbacterales bacterium]
MSKLPTLTELHKQALSEHWAVPHFNFSSLAQLNGILDGLKESKSPAALGTSEGERKFIGAKQALYLVRSFREEEDIPVYINADHHKTPESALEAFDAGYESIHADFSKESYEDNIAGVQKVVEKVKKNRPDVEVEGELGYFVTESSKIYKEAVEIPEDSYTKAEQAVDFVEKTGIDRFAPVIGNLHGIAANKPVIRFDLVEKLRQALPNITFVLHGGSGIVEEDMKKLVSMGFNNIHVSTELRIAYTEALRQELAEKPEEVAPYHYLDQARKAVAEVVKEKVKIFGSVGRV